MMKRSNAPLDKDRSQESALDARNGILVLSCPDRIGIVAEVARVLVEHNCNIIDSAQYGDVENGMFFMRTTFRPLSKIGLPQLRAAFEPLVANFGMRIELHSEARKVPTLILVSRFGHCLNDLMFRSQIEALPIDIRAIASNHLDFKERADTASVDYCFLPITAESKRSQEKDLVNLIENKGIELIVLARYMQVLSPEFCAAFPGQIINIHHSFLPSFKGSRPYQQAHARGVKLIGATAHYVTSDLDEGPIIEQAVERVSHGHSASDFVAIGRDIESMVLARAVKWHAEHRVLLNGSRTVVFV